MTENSNHASGSYFFACHDGEPNCSPETVFLRIDDESLTPFLLGFLKKIYGGREGNPKFHTQAVDTPDQAQRSSRDKAIHGLAAGSQDPWPPRETMLRASYAQMAKSWVKVRRSREANDSDQTPVEQLEASLQKLKEATSTLFNGSEKVDLDPRSGLTTYRQALCDAEAHVDGISAHLSGQIETGLHDTLDSLSRAVEHVISGDKVRPAIYQLPNEINEPVRKAFDYFSRIYTELSQSEFKPDSDLFKNCTAAESHVDTPEGVFLSEEACEAQRERRQMERSEWVRIWVERQGKSKKAWLTGEAIDRLRALAESIQHWASGLDSAVRDLLRCDDDGASRRNIIRQIVEDYGADPPMFLTAPFENRNLPSKTIDLNQEHHKMWKELGSRLKDLEKKRKLLRDKVVEEVRQWNENNRLHSCPHLILESSCLQGTAEDCIKRIYSFVDVLQRESNRGSMGSPSRNIDEKTDSNSSLPPYIFRRKGSMWEIRFDGHNEFHLPDRKGAEYLRQLLLSPGKAVDTFDIVAQSSAQACANLMSAHEAIDSGLTVSENPLLASSGEISDGKALKEYRSELLGLLAKREKLKRDNSTVELDLIEKDIAIIVEEIRKSVGIHGKLNMAGDKRRNLRDACSKNIKRFIAEIKKTDTACAEHFEQSITYGNHPIYRSNVPINWETEFILA